jgi:predicted ATPase
MKIRSIILKGVRNFKNFEQSFEDSWSGKIPDSLLLIGPNGSGKTTLLNVVAGLWQLLYDSLGNDEKDLDQKPFGIYLATAKLAAIEITGFLNTPPFWLFAGNNLEEFDAFVQAHPQDLRIGRLYRIEAITYLAHWDNYYYLPGTNQAGETDATGAILPTWYIEWRERLVQNVYGNKHDLPNLVFMESESRLLAPIKDSGGITPEPDEFQWLSRYEPSTSRKGSLQNYLFGLKAVNPDTYNNVIQQVNSFLFGKKLVDFSTQSYELMVEVGQERHRAVDLSSGEKQILLMLATITRRLEPGGIVLIDEPDLHLHVSMMNAFVGHLRRFVEKKGGQLILASHAPELWREFTETETVRLGFTSGRKSP